MNNPDHKPQNQPEPNLLAGETTQFLAIDMNNAGLICYVPACGINVLAPIAFLVTEPKSNHFLRFHAIQSLLLSSVYVLFGMVIALINSLLSAVPFLQLLTIVPNLLWVA